MLKTGIVFEESELEQFRAHGGFDVLLLPPGFSLTASDSTAVTGVSCLSLGEFNHVHMMISIPPKYAVLQVVGYIKGKSSIHLARVYAEKKRNFVGQHFWARGYFVSTVGRDEQVIRSYIRHQENEDERLEQLGLWK